MTGLWGNLPAYRQITGLELQTAYTYRVNFAFQVLRILLRVYLLKVIWTAVYAGQGNVGGLELRQVIAFVTLAQLQVWVLSPLIADYLQDRVSEGKIALDLARPVPFLGQLLAHQVGGTASLFPFVLLAVPLALALGGFVPPASVSAGLLYLLSLALAYLVSVLIGMALGLVSFWTLRLGWVMGIYVYVSQFFTGALVPLTFFPPWLRSIADLLPFQAQAFIPLSIYMGQVPARELPATIGVQLIWVVVLFALASAMWQRAMRRVVVQGG